MYNPLILLKGGVLHLNQTEKEELVQLVMLSFFNIMIKPGAGSGIISNALSIPRPVI